VPPECKTAIAKLKDDPGVPASVVSIFGPIRKGMLSDASWHDTNSVYNTHWTMIRSFRGKFAETILRGRRIPKGFPADVIQAARRKLVMLDRAITLRDLGSLPGNRLEALKGNLVGKHSIRINSQWRIIFLWTDEGPEDVEITDYH